MHNFQLFFSNSLRATAIPTVDLPELIKPVKPKLQNYDVTSSTLLSFETEACNAK